MYKNTLLGLIFVSAAAFTGCLGDRDPTSLSGDSGLSGQTIEVVATVGMVADLVRTIGGEHVSVLQICGSGVDPHQYQPIPDDVRAIMGADIVFYCGLMLEGKMQDTLKKQGKTRPVIAVAEWIPEAELISPLDFGGHHDPHVWNDVSLWSHCVDGIRDELAKLDPEHADSFSVNAESLKAQMAALHSWGKEIMATIPQESRLLVTSHDAFNYFGRAYGLEVMGVQGISTESEAGLQRINQLIDILIERDVNAVFIESSVSVENIEALIEGAQSKNHSVSVGGELFSDAMGKKGDYEGTYIGMLDHNLTTTALALGGKVDAGGFQGKLHGGEVAAGEVAP